ncbi:MAG: trypsin-like serine protease [Planctomycetota bacterium]
MSSISLAREGCCAGPRIIDGTLVPESQFPTVGRIGSTGNLDFCTGTLIAPRFVLLACHCVNNQTTGSFSFGQKQGVFVLQGKTFMTSHIYVHPTYTGDDAQQREGAIDLAIFELTSNAKETPTPLYRKAPTVGTLLTLTGFGLLGTGTTGVSNDVPPRGKIATGTTPIDIVTNTFIEWNFENVAAPNQESNTAPGDSGGPQFITEDGIRYLASVTSGGIKSNASFGDLSYNTRVDIATAWIDSITGGTPVDGNHAPVITAFSSSALGVIDGTPVTFTASATDADGDTLQYHWIYNDGSETLNGSATETHTFSSAGTYLVQLIVTDKKGGSVARDVTIGVLSSTPLASTLQPATLVKKTFSLDFSSKATGGALNVIIQSPSLQFADAAAFAAAFKPTTRTLVYLGNTQVGSFFGTTGSTSTGSFKFDYKKGKFEYKTTKNASVLAPLNFYGAQNATLSSTFSVPISVEFRTNFFQAGPVFRFGGDATIQYTSKVNVIGKGK